MITVFPIDGIIKFMFQSPNQTNMTNSLPIHLIWSWPLAQQPILLPGLQSWGIPHWRPWHNLLHLSGTLVPSSLVISAKLSMSPVPGNLLGAPFPRCWPCPTVQNCEAHCENKTACKWLIPLLVACCENGRSCLTIKLSWIGFLPWSAEVWQSTRLKLFVK